MSQDTLHYKVAFDSTLVKKSVPLAKKILEQKNLAANHFGNDSLQVIGQSVVSLPDSTSAYHLLINTDTVFRFSDLDTVRATNESYSPTLKFFSDNLISSDRQNPETFNRPVPDWFTIIFLLIVFGLMWIKVFYAKIFKHLKDAFFSSLVANQVVRDENLLVQRASVLLSVIFYLVAALFAYLITVYSGVDSILPSGFGRFIVFAFGIAFAYSLKMIMLKVSGFIFDAGKPAAAYIFNVFLINNVLGLLLIPMVAMMAYLPHQYKVYTVYASILLVVFAFLFRLFRGFDIGYLQARFSFVHLFLYLCAFEIAPILLLYKLTAG